eukprot:GHVP01062682.1.p1 GENE.GHVP01062682.1~~GHVP01062682.1.p1  ORF type:complete len:184 (+),score=33.76 GHVP01062682.1:49-600(+)
MHFIVILVPVSKLVCLTSKPQKSIDGGGKKTEIFSRFCGVAMSFEEPINDPRNINDKVDYSILDDLMFKGAELFTGAFESLSIYGPAALDVLRGEFFPPSVAASELQRASDSLGGRSRTHEASEATNLKELVRKKMQWDSFSADDEDQAPQWVDVSRPADGVATPPVSNSPYSKQWNSEAIAV